MKLTPTLVLSVSLAANIALGVVLVKNRNANAPSAAGTRSTSLNSDTRKTASSSAKSGGADGDIWKKLSADSDTGSDTAERKYTALKDRLRAAGFPDKMINAIITAQIRERFAERRASLQADTGEFWSKSWNQWGGGDAKTRTAMRELWKAERQEVRAALGEEYPDSPDFQRMMARQYGNISKEKALTLQGITEDYQELTMEIQGNGMMLPEDREKLAFLEKEKRADMAAVLSPAELQDYEMRSSQTANSLRYQLSAFSPSEQEFRTVFSLQREFDLQYPNRNYNNDEAGAKARSDAENAMQQQIKASLGETRYAEYQRAKDGNFQQLNNLTERLELPKENAIAVYDLSKDMEKRANQIRNDKNLKGDARTQALAALAEEANTKVTQSLGTRGAEAYKENGGWWLRNLKR